MTDNTSYYYVNGEQLPLLRRPDIIAIKLKADDVRNALTRGSWTFSSLGFQEEDIAEVWPGGTVLVRQDIAVTRSVSQQDKELRELNERHEVEYASSVYEHAPDDLWVVTNQFVVQFQEGTTEWEMVALEDEYKVKRVEPITWLPGAYLLQITSASPGDALTVANAYVEAGKVIFAHPNFLRKQVQRCPPLHADSELTKTQWHLHAIDAFAAWEITCGSPDVIVAIIDDGVDLDHVAFENQVSEHFDAVDESNDPRPPTAHHKDYRHGTACAGLAVGAANAAVGTSGVAPRCRLMAIRLLDDVVPQIVGQKLDQALNHEEQAVLYRGLATVQPYREARAIHWAAEHGAWVISNSWGPPDGRHTWYPMFDLVRLAVDYAADQGRDGKGCIICWAAGNGNESVSLDGYASYPKVLAVAACTTGDHRAPYSDYGTEIRVCAPGGGYEEDALKDGLLTTVEPDPEYHVAYRDDFNGTSAATPIVAGVAALLLSVFPDLTRDMVYKILCASADKIDPTGGNYDVAGHSHYYGYGRVNACRALEEAAKQCS